jgi:uncharacterized membrane protein
MSTSLTTPISRRAGVDWRRAEFVLTGLAFLGFITLPVRISTISTDLPAHPLFVHVPVVLIPLSVLGALAVTIRPRWFDRYGVLLCLCSIVAMSSIFLAMRAGAALEGLLHLQGQAAVLISEHTSAAHILAFGFIALTAVLILSFSSHRISGGRPTGLAIADVPLSHPAVRLTLRVLLVILAIFCAYYVYHVGDLGARAVWQQQLQVARQ